MSVRWRSTGGFAASQWAADSRHDSHQGNQDLAILKAVLVEVPLPPAFLSLPVRRYGATGERPLPQEARAGVVPRTAAHLLHDGPSDDRRGPGTGIETGHLTGVLVVWAVLGSNQ